jgi:hypothetical protein
MLNNRPLFTEFSVTKEPRNRVTELKSAAIPKRTSGQAEG